MKLELDSSLCASGDAEQSGRESFQGKTDQETKKRPRDQETNILAWEKHPRTSRLLQEGKIQLQKQVTKSGTCVPESHKCNIRPILGAEITDGIIRDVPLPIHTRTMNTYQRKNEWWQRWTFVEQKSSFDLISGWRTFTKKWTRFWSYLS